MLLVFHIFVFVNQVSIPSSVYLMFISRAIFQIFFFFFCFFVFCFCFLFFFFFVFLFVFSFVFFVFFFFVFCFSFFVFLFVFFCFFLFFFVFLFCFSDLNGTRIFCDPAVPKGGAPVGGGGGGGNCFKCNQPGHRSRDCTGAASTGFAAPSSDVSFPWFFNC